MLGEAGCTEIQIAAITGHSVINSQVCGYLNMGQNLAIDAYQNLEKNLLQKQNNYFLLSNGFLTDIQESNSFIDLL